eukprot:scaffold448644_cov15-Prasinocladus_malaysianus.AAC.2
MYVVATRTSTRIAMRAVPWLRRLPNSSRFCDQFSGESKSKKHTAEDLDEEKIRSAIVATTYYESLFVLRCAEAQHAAQDG